MEKHTRIENKISILSEIYSDRKDDEYLNSEEWQDFMDYSDMGLPLAYLIQNDVVPITLKAHQFID